MPTGIVTELVDAFRLSQQEFAARFNNPIDTIRDWERGVSEPDAAAKGYLCVIAREQKMVRDAELWRPLPGSSRAGQGPSWSRPASPSSRCAPTRR